MTPNKAQQSDHKELELQLLLLLGLGHSGSKIKSLKFEFSELLPTVGSSYYFLVALGLVSKLQVMVLAASTSAVLVHRTAVWCHKTIVPAFKIAGPADKTAGSDHKINELSLKKPQL